MKNAVSGSRAPQASVGGVWNSSQRPKLISSQRNGLAGSDSHVTFAREGWPGLAERTTEAYPQQRILCCRSPSFIQWLFVVWCLSESNIFFIVATFSRTIRSTGHRICATEMTTTRSISNGTMTDLCKLVLFFLDFFHCEVIRPCVVPRTLNPPVEYSSRWEIRSKPVRGKFPCFCGLTSFICSIFG